MAKRGVKKAKKLKNAKKPKKVKKPKKAKKAKLRSNTRTLRSGFGQWLPLTKSGPLHLFRIFCGPITPDIGIEKFKDLGNKGFRDLRV